MLILEKIRSLPVHIIGTVVFIACMGILMLYSAAGANVHPWAFKQAVRFAFGLFLMLIMANIEARSWMASAYIFYATSLILLLLVEFMGFVGMGAQRWLDLQLFNLQPSELMRIALLLALARYFYDKDADDLLYWKTLLPPLLMVLVPVLLVCRQPDLGTALLLLFGAVSIFFVGGIHWGYFAGGFSLVLCLIPVFWSFLHDYQKNRVLNFLTPERDPSNTGYHVIQSKIALGSAGLFGKGFLKGSQSHLNFLPEKQTDFIFAMFCEEFGFFGGVFLILLYGFWLFSCLEIVLSLKQRFHQLLGVGIVSSFFVYVFVNIAMVVGLLPVVGIPLPFFSYGGTALVTLLMSQGILFSLYLSQNRKSRYVSS
ncbi:MAG: Peptidoglycan glycosyltransferase MrdB [Holosporales bacterium]